MWLEAAEDDTGCRVSTWRIASVEFISVYLAREAMLPASNGMNYRVIGGKTLSGTVQTNISKNAAVALLAASLLNRGETILKKMPRIEEVKRLIEVMESIGVKIEWADDGDMRITPPEKIDLSRLNTEAAARTRSIALFIAPLAHLLGSFDLPAPAGCDLGKRTLGSHIDALAKLGIHVTGSEDTHTYHVETKRSEEHTSELQSQFHLIFPLFLYKIKISFNDAATTEISPLSLHAALPIFDALAKLGIHVTGSEDTHTYHVETKEMKPAEIIMYEASDTGAENVLMAAAKIKGTTTIKFASANYMVQDVCIFLRQCGVKIDGIGTSTLVVHGLSDINAEIHGHPSEDPIESMFFISLAAMTKSEITIERCPMDFLELELFTLSRMGLQYSRSEKYASENGHTVLRDLTIKPSELVAPPDKIAPRPYPGINIDNLPFFVPVATQAQGDTLIHDWVYDGRAHWYLEINKLGANASLLDPHRVLIKGPTTLHGADIEAPPALRPATMLLIGMLAAEGESTLRNVYPINRGYANLADRLKRLGASIEEAD